MSIARYPGLKSGWQARDGEFSQTIFFRRRMYSFTHGHKFYNVFSSSPALFLLLETSLKTRWSKNLSFHISGFHLSTAVVISELALSSGLFLAHIWFITAETTVPAVMSAWLDSMHLLLICLEVMMQRKCWSNYLLLSLSKIIAMHVLYLWFTTYSNCNIFVYQSHLKTGMPATEKFSCPCLWSPSIHTLLQVRVLKDQLDVLTRRLGVPLASGGASRTAEDLWPFFHWDPIEEPKTYHVLQNIWSPWSEMTCCVSTKSYLKGKVLVASIAGLSSVPPIYIFQNCLLILPSNLAMIKRGVRPPWSPEDHRHRHRQRDTYQYFKEAPTYWQAWNNAST